MTFKLLRLPALVLLLAAGACQPSSPTAEGQPAALTTCTGANAFTTTCSDPGSAPAVLFCDPPDAGAGWETRELCSYACAMVDSVATCIAAPCTPGATTCDDGNKLVCGANGKWLPAGSCRANACQCGGKWPKCDVCQ